MHRFATEFTMRLAFLRSKAVEHKGSSGSALFRLIEDARGATAIEYALIAALIAMAFVVLVAQIGDFVSVPFETVASQL